jgi:hypothetical protein
MSDLAKLRNALVALAWVHDDPKRWCQGALALDSNGHPTFKDAVQWCIIGAVAEIGDRLGIEPFYIREELNKIGPGNLAILNDNCSYGSVRKLELDALARVEARIVKDQA